MANIKFFGQEQQRQYVTSNIIMTVAIAVSQAKNDNGQFQK